MKSLARIGILISSLLLPALSGYGQCRYTSAPTIDPATGNITTSGTYRVNATDERTQRIIDARPNRVYAAIGKTRFGKTGTVVIANMNPFLFEGYRISIQEEEIKEDALVKFTKALIPIAGDFIETQKQEAAFRSEKEESGELEVLKSRLLNAPTALAAAALPAHNALTHMRNLKVALVTDEQAIRNYFTDGPAPPAGSYLNVTQFSLTKERFLKYGGVIFDRDTDTTRLCDNVHALSAVLTTVGAYPSQIDLRTKQKAIDDMVSKAKALQKAVELYKEQDLLKGTKWIGTQGFDYVEDLGLFATELINLANNKYKVKAQDLYKQVAEFDNMKTSIKNLNGMESTLLQQEFRIGGKYDFSKITVTVQPFGEKTPKNPSGETSATRNGDKPAGSDGNQPLSSPPSTGNAPEQTELAHASGKQFAEAGGDKKEDQKPPAPEGPGATTDVVTAGKPRFEIGVGMAYTQVEKREFQPITGFARDREGNLTNGETFTNVVGFSEKTDHRLSPVVLLHTRLTDFPKHNLYFSLGITGSRDKLGTNIEYLIGPSVNVTEHIFITAGAFAARQHELAGDDLFVGAGVPSGFDSISVRSRYRWKPGISFSYRLPITGSTTKSVKAAQNGNATGAYTDTVYAGQPRFSISAGMAYSSLRNQTFQPIIGFARDRDGALTNGETFTKVVGFSENSDGRFLPMALLNTRIIANDDMGLHFSLGITAKRTDENTDVEYLIGPSFSFWKNQIVFTAGAYAGKRDKIAGDLFINAAVPDDLSLTTQREYHFKPGISFSYRLPVKLP